MTVWGFLHGNPIHCVYLTSITIVQALSNTVWSFSKLGHEHNQLLDTIAAVTLRKLPSFNAQNIANTVRLTSIIGGCSHTWTVTKICSVYKCAECGMLMYSFASFKHLAFLFELHVVLQQLHEHHQAIITGVQTPSATLKPKKGFLLPVASKANVI